jgi:O6-methylguanine-DNA--protein-cysteine methyltransferase
VFALARLGLDRVRHHAWDREHRRPAGAGDSDGARHPPGEYREPATPADIAPTSRRLPASLWRVEGRPLDAASRQNPDFTSRVLAMVRRIPYGRVATYGEVAAMAGRP